MRSMPPSLPRKQNGAVLFIGLIMLLVITMLAVTSMREVTLESRITGNVIEQKRLTNEAESTLRGAERAIFQRGAPLDLCGTAAGLCYNEDASSSSAKYGANFNNANTYHGLYKVNSDGTTGPLYRKAKWYARYISSDCTGATDALTGGSPGCSNYYEINAQASSKNNAATDECGGSSLCLRSTISVLNK